MTYQQIEVIKSKKYYVCKYWFQSTLSVGVVILQLCLMIYHLPERISLKTRSSCIHYIIMSNLLQFIQFIHYPLLPLVFYLFIVLYIRACILCLF